MKPSPTPTKAPDLTAESERGYGTIPNAVPPPALAWTNAAIEQYLASQRSANPTPVNDGVAISTRAGQRQIIGLTGVPEKLGAVALYLMGLPAVAKIAYDLCGPTATPSHDWMVIKAPGDGRVIEWHQDFTHRRQYPAISLGIHLDDARADALRVIPGTQSQHQDLCELRARLDFNAPEVLPLDVTAGGLVWHDVMLVHGSPARPADAYPRKTYYIEFRPVQALREHPGFPPEYVDLRQEIFAAAQALNHRLGPTPSGDPYSILNTNETNLIAQHTKLSARLDLANYCTPLPK